MITIWGMMMLFAWAFKVVGFMQITINPTSGLGRLIIMFGLCCSVATNVYEILSGGSTVWYFFLTVNTLILSFLVNMEDLGKGSEG